MDPDDRLDSAKSRTNTVATPGDATVDPIQDLTATNEKEEAVRAFIATQTVEAGTPPAPSSDDGDPDVDRASLHSNASIAGPSALGHIPTAEDGPSTCPSSPHGSQERIHIQGSPSVHEATVDGDVDSIPLVRWWLYLAEVFGRWGDRMWSFTASLFLLELFPGTLLWPAIHGLVTGACVILFGSLIGDWVDRTARRKAVRTALCIQNSCVACGSLILTLAFWYRDTMSATGLILCVVGFLAFAVVADCASVGMNIIVEKDWVVVIAAGDQQRLADLNAAIRRIDLTCQILSPIIIAQIMTFSAHYVGTIVVSAWNVCSMGVEYVILMKIYRRVPRLAVKPLESPTDNVQGRRPLTLTRRMFKSCWAIHDGWNIYFANRVWPAGLGLAFLYMTVLGFGGVTNTYIRTQGLSESVISVAMGVGAAVGIAGTLVFPWMRRKLGLERTGLVAVVAQLLPLMLCIVSIWLAGSPFDPHFYSTASNATVLQVAELNRTAPDMDEKRWITKPTEELPSVVVFLVGMIVARFGLWMADLTITQLMQECIAEKERGIVGGVQSSFNRFMDMLKFILVIGLPDPQTFGFLIILSCVFVATGHVLYAVFAVRSGRASRSRSRSRSVPVGMVTRDSQPSPSPPSLPTDASLDT